MSDDTVASEKGGLPDDFRAYLSSSDKLFRAQLLQERPLLAEELKDPSVRTALLAWIASSEAKGASLNAMRSNALEFLRTGASPEEADVVRRFLLDLDPNVRLGAFEFLLTLYFPDKDPEALLMLLHSMLMDPSDLVRSQAVHYIERSGLAGRLRDFLRSWLDAAAARGWDTGEDYELVSRLVDS